MTWPIAVLLLVVFGIVIFAVYFYAKLKQQKEMIKQASERMLGILKRTAEADEVYLKQVDDLIHRSKLSFIELPTEGNPGVSTISSAGAVQENSKQKN